MPENRTVRCPFHAKMVSTDSGPSEERPGLKENFVAKVLSRREPARQAGLGKSLGLTEWTY